MTISLFLIHGLPGVGKTTLCRSLAQHHPELFYVDFAADPDFGSVPMAQLCVSRYNAASRGQSILTEAVAAGRGSRDKLVGEIVLGLRVHHGIDDVNACIIYIDECDSSLIAGRRKRSEAEYRTLKARVQQGSRQFEYIVYVTDEHERLDLDERRSRIWGIIEPRLRRVTAQSAG